jgi:hypothetical protein
MPGVYITEIPNVPGIELPGGFKRGLDIAAGAAGKGQMAMGEAIEEGGRDARQGPSWRRMDAPILPVRFLRQ